MKSIKVSEKIVGVLFLVQMIAAVISHTISDLILYNKNFLEAISANSIEVISGMLLNLVCGASVFAIAVILFPIFKRHSEPIALW
jgi:hypothetical protein